MSEQTTTKRAYRRISAEHLAYARKRFAEFASTSAVRAELKARGGDYSHSQLHYHWHLANKGFGGALARRTVPAERGPGLVVTSGGAAFVHAGDDADADHGPDEARPA